jgi:hypothetical protein
MCRVFWLFVLALASLPADAQAIQLHWGDGSTALSFAEDTRAVLVIQADSASTLPSSWVVNWVADSASIRWIAVDSLFACLADTAKVDSIWGPLTPADSAAELSDKPVSHGLV